MAITELELIVQCFCWLPSCSCSCPGWEPLAVARQLTRWRTTEIPSNLTHFVIPLKNKASKCVIGCVFQHFHIIKISLGKGERERERETENWLPSCPCSCPGWVFYLSPVQGGHTDSRACIPSSWQFVEQCRHSSYINCMWESPIHLPTVYLQLNRLTEVLSKPALIL